MLSIMYDVVLAVVIFLATVLFFELGKKKADAKAKADTEAVARAAKETEARRKTEAAKTGRHTGQHTDRHTGPRQQAVENALYEDMKLNSDKTYYETRRCTSSGHSVNRIQGIGIDFIPGIETIRSTSINEPGRQSMRTLIRLATDPGILKILEKKKLHIDELREQTEEEDKTCLGSNSGQGRSIGIKCKGRYDIKKEMGDTFTESDEPYTLVDTLIHELAHCDEGGGKSAGHDTKFHTRRKELKAIYMEELQRIQDYQNNTTTTGNKMKTTSVQVAEQFHNVDRKTARKAINEFNGEVPDAMNKLDEKHRRSLPRNVMHEMRLTHNEMWANAVKK
jgi:hypothetical protein